MRWCILQDSSQWPNPNPSPWSITIIMWLERLASYKQCKSRAYVTSFLVQVRLSKVFHSICLTMKITQLCPLTSMDEASCR
jgi:hypothetical protein